MEVLKGAAVSAAMKEKLTAEVMTMEADGKKPHLAIVRVGARPDDLSYERGASKRMAGIGISVTSFAFPADIADETFKKEFSAINENADIDGILLLRPLPKQIDEEGITRMIDPAKDVDCISPVNMAKLFMGDAGGFAPCTAEAVIEMIKYRQIPISGKRVVIAGRSLVVGKPLAMLFLQENATVTICHSKTVQMSAVCQEADILVAAIGRARMLDASFVREGGMVFDVGINVDETGALCGDVAFDTLEGHAALATPVPGGVGSVTTSVLAKHVIRAAKEKRSK